MTNQNKGFTSKGVTNKGVRNKGFIAKVSNQALRQMLEDNF
jgi:hypothetical protein